MLWNWLLPALIGCAAAHVIRRLIPSILKLKNRNLPFTWPWLESIGALLFLLTALRFGWPAGLPWYLFCLIALVAIGTDYGFKYIPDLVHVVGVSAGLIASCLFPETITSFLGHQELVWAVMGSSSVHLGGFILGLSGAVLGALLLESLRRVLGKFADMEVMGQGDVWFMAFLGAFLGPELIILVLLPASLIGIASGTVFRIIFKIPHAPFGPPLAFGAIALAYYHGAFISAIDRFYLELFALSRMAKLLVFGALIATLIALMVRIRRRASSYSEMIEKDYQKIDEEFEDP